MEQRTVRMLFALLRSAIRGTKLTDEERSNYSAELRQKMLDIAEKHDIAHLLALGLKNNSLLTKEEVGVEKCVFMAAYRYERKRHELERLCATLEHAGIPFMPLKGAVIQKYYPEEWMRTSCDIDILVHEEDTEDAVDVLVNVCGYTYGRKGPHDHSLFAPGRVHVELHYKLIEGDEIGCASKMLATVWDNALPKPGFVFWHEMSDEMFYFYHLAHMAKHFEIGGCGIRTFLDLWLLDNLRDVDNEKRDALLREGNLLAFAEAARKLSCIWFECVKGDSVAQQMEAYVLHGGVYGSVENRVLVQQQKRGGRCKYVLTRLFLPYDVIKFQYPVLMKHRWLTPVMEIRRWSRLLSSKRRKRATKELRHSSKLTNVDTTGIRSLLDSIGL